MGNLLGVAVTQGQNHLSEDNTCFLLRKEALLNDFVKKLTAGAQPE